MKTTFYTHAEHGNMNLVDVASVNWIPVLNCRDRDEALQMTAARFLRLRGGIRAGEVVAFGVWVRDSMDVPCVVHTYALRASNDGAEAGKGAAA